MWFVCVGGEVVVYFGVVGCLLFCFGENCFEFGCLVLFRFKIVDGDMVLLYELMKFYFFFFIG